ncbi:MAG: cysteine synthase A [Oleiphilaceae bacterium]|jgi:cysteine synthase A
MTKIYNNIIELIGNTPMIKLNKISNHLPGNIYAKLEMYNPMSSVKDRIALSMINNAEKDGLIEPGKSVIIEATSGNTGIGLGLVAKQMGYRTMVVLADTMSIERVKVLKAQGVEVVRTPGADGFAAVIAKVKELLETIPNAWSPMQFDNMANPKAHYETTGMEIWRDMEGDIDMFVTGLGTGGTISGVGRYLKEQNPLIKIVAVEPENCALLSGGEPGLHKIQGLNAGFIAKTTDVSLIDEAIIIQDQDAFTMTRFLLREEGVFGGISTGASLYGAIELAKRPENEGKNIVTLFPSGGERYLSTPLWDIDDL